MKILSIDTSCDETAAAVTEDTTILSNIIWSQASLHNKWGGVFPSLAKRAHQERIDFVVNKALQSAKCKVQNTDAVAVTVGPGLSIALEVGISKAKELSTKYRKPFIAVNHIEGHLLSCLAQPRNPKYQTQVVTSNSHISFPALGFIASGKHTDLVLVKGIGEYKIIAHTIDDALGEALDKAARMLGLGYPGGAILEKLAKEGDENRYNLPIPMLGRENQFEFSYSGLKTAFWRLTENQKPLTKNKIQYLAASFQNIAFVHVERLVKKALEKHKVKSFLFGGGVSSNIELRKRLRKICLKEGVVLHLPYSKKLCTDNAGMIGVAAYFKSLRNEYEHEIEKVDRLPNAKIDQQFTWE